VKIAGGFSAEVRVEKDGLEVNGKSIMGVLMLAAERGSLLTIRAEGGDAVEALAALSGLVARGFEEE
jgi:phosphocarrier protein